METTIEELRILNQLRLQDLQIKKDSEKARNMTILTLRLKDGLTYQAIGTRYGLTRERIRQIINETLN